MAIRIARIGSPRAPGEGLRLGAMRRPPRGVRKTDCAKRDYYDAWLPELAPSAAIVSWAHAAEWTPVRWRRYVRIYLREMREPRARHLIGAHSILYSNMPQRDRNFLRDVLGFPSVDAGDGWLNFGLPPSEVAVHPSEKNDVHEFYLMCDDVEALIADLTRRKVACSPVRNQGWGLAHPGGAAGGRQAWHLPDAARPAAQAHGMTRRTAALAFRRAERPA